MKRKPSARYVTTVRQNFVFLKRSLIMDFGQKWIQGIKGKREAKAEKERYAKLAEKMHIKRVERLKRREKRNKMLKS
jgi:hypothetical protein